MYLRAYRARVFIAIFFSIALLASFSLAQTVTPPQRVLVKLQANLAKDVEASLPLQNMTLAPGQAMGAQTQAFMNRHGALKLAPMYPQLVRVKKQRGWTDLQIASAIQQSFPARAHRFHGNFQPPQISRTYVLQFSAATDINLELANLRNDSNVAFAEPDHVVRTNLTPNDPYFSSYGSWGQAYDDLWGIKEIGSPSAWDTSTGAGVVVAVVDTGLDYNHPDLAANVWTNTKEIAGNGIDDDGNGYIDDVLGWDFIGSTYRNPTQGNNPIDHFGHGTHVAGTIAAVGNNGIGVIGVAFQAHVMAVKGLDDSGYGLDSTLGPAIIYAANNGAEIISNSWAGQGTSQTIADAVSYAYSLGAVIVAAAGNNSDDARKYYPANLPQVITVAATNPSDFIAYFSNWGEKIDVAAPGVDILSLRAAGTSMGTPVDAYYTRADGTSMATPHVSGLAALVLAQHPQYTNEEVRQAIRASADDLSPAGFDFTYGYGRINASSAVALSNALETKILSPADGTHIKAATTISGLADGSGFSQYVLDFGAGPLPNSWTIIQSGVAPVTGGALGVFDPSTLPDGIYTLRLTTYDTANHKFVDQLELVVDDVAITAPPPPLVPVTANVYKPGVSIPIVGTATGPSFQDFRLEFAEGINPSSGWSNFGISLTGGGMAPITNATVGTWDTSTLLPFITYGDYFTIRLSVDNSGFTSVATTLVYLEPSLLSTGWPQWLNQAPNLLSGVVPALDNSGAWHLTLANPGYLNTSVPAQFWNFSADGFSKNVTPITYGNMSQPSAGDLDGIPGDEVVLGDGLWLDNFTLNNSFSTLSPPVLGNFQYSPAILEDLAGDSQLERIALGVNFQTQTASVFAWRRDNTLLNSNFPLTVQDQNTNLRFAFNPRVLVGDLDGDGKREILVEEGASPSSFALRLFASDGSAKPAWSTPTFNGYTYAMALADLDHNGTLETIFVCYCNSVEQLHVLQPDGTERPGWPVTIGSGGISSIAIGDLNRDGAEEIVVSDYNNIYVFEPNGTTFSSAWPLTANSMSPFGPVILADINGDGLPEIITTQAQFLYSPSPLLQSANAPLQGSIQLSTAPVAAGGTVAPPTTTIVNAQSYSSNQYEQPRLLALRFDGTTVRSWNLLGADGNQPDYIATLTAGDFKQNGTTDIAVVYPIISGGGTSGYLSEGVATVLSTGAPFQSAANDWPMNYQNPRNTAVLIRDHTPPVISITSPANGASVGGIVILSAAASDNVGVVGVQFQLDGSNLGQPDTTAPFTLSWDTSTATVGNHTLIAQAWDAAGNIATSAAVAITVLPPFTVSFSPSTLSFGGQVIGTASAPLPVTVTNTGTSTVNISAVQTGGDFSQTSNCIGSLAAGGSCTVQVTFTPTIRGAENGQLSLVSNTNQTSSTVSLTGTGQAVSASLSPASLNFGNQNIGSTSSAQTLVYTNTGDVALNITGVSASGDFAQTNTCGTSVAVGAACNISVSFKPTVRGAESGSVSVSGMVAETATLSGSGLALLASFSPTSLNFGSLPVGTTSASQTVTVTNVGDAPFYINQWSNPGAYNVTNNCPTPIAVNASCTFTVSFSPTAGTSYNGALSIGGNFSGSPANISLSGTGLATVGVLSLTNLNFGNQVVGTHSAVQATTLINTGNTTLNITGVQISGDFSQTNICPASLAPHDTCPINVTFTPTTSGARNGTLTVSSNANSPIPPATLNGTGIAPSITAGVSSSSLNFATQIVGTTSAAQIVTLTSTGNTAVSLSSIQVTGDFSQTNNCPSSLGPGANCSINVSFTPSATGSRTGALTISSNANSGVPLSVSLSGSGVDNAPTLSPTSIAFGNVFVGKGSGNKSVKLTANGPAALTISGIAVSAGFTQTNNCPASLSKGSSCNITVVFAPTSAGAQSGTLAITDNGLGGTQTVALSGTGLDFTVSASPSSSNVTAGGKAVYTVTVSPVGGSYSSNVSLSCSNLPAGTKCSFSPSGVSPGANPINSTLTMTTSSGANGTPTGSHVITITGTANNTAHATTVTLIVN